VLTCGHYQSILTLLLCLVCAVIFYTCDDHSDRKLQALTGTVTFNKAEAGKDVLVDGEHYECVYYKIIIRCEGERVKKCELNHFLCGRFERPVIFQYRSVPLWKKWLTTKLATFHVPDAPKLITALGFPTI